MNNLSGIANIQEILEENGYPVKFGNDYISTAGLFRGGDNNGAICIYPEKNLVIDFVTSERYNIPTLIGRILGITEKEKIEEYLSSKNYNPNSENKQIQEPLITMTKTLKKDFLDKLDKSDKAQEYWINRGISLDILKLFSGGVYKDKYYFPVLDKDKNLLGWSARVVKGKSEKRYIIRGEKKNFLYDINLSDSHIQESKEVNLIEGIPDNLSLFECGIKNNLVQFGTDISFTIVNYLLRIPDITINILANNDHAGMESSEKIFRKLSKYFDSYKIHIKATPDINGSKDINDLLLTKDGRKTIIELYGRK